MPTKTLAAPKLRKAKSRVSTKIPKATKPASANGTGHRRIVSAKDVFTLSDAAAFLRVPASSVLELAQSGRIPGQQIGSDWRFLKSALCDWLADLSPKAATSSKEHLLSLAGKYASEPEFLNDILDATSRSRGRPMGRVDE